MDLQFTLESFDSLSVHWKKLQDELKASTIFSLPQWLEVWWKEFGSGAKLYLGAARHGDRVVGIAPLSVTGGIVSFIGGEDVCDYLDFIIEPGVEDAFFRVLLGKLAADGLNQLDLAPLRPDSPVLTGLVAAARSLGWQTSCSKEDVSVELDLPGTWDEYLEILTTKQRHELRRKQRRLAEAGQPRYRISPNGANDLDIFINLFQHSRQDKAAFLTPKMESFFRSIALAMAELGLLRLGILELNTASLAATMCFDYKNRIYLYNSGYDPLCSRLSGGLIAKVLSIKDSIEKGRERYDFLKGGETYKYHLGGHEVPLYRCRMNLTQ